MGRGLFSGCVVTVVVPLAIAMCMSAPFLCPQRTLNARVHCHSPNPKRLFVDYTDQPQSSNRLPDRPVAIRMLDRADFHLAISGHTWEVIKTHYPRLIPNVCLLQLPHHHHQFVYLTPCDAIHYAIAKRPSSLSPPCCFLL